MLAQLAHTVVSISVTEEKMRCSKCEMINTVITASSKHKQVFLRSSAILHFDANRLQLISGLTNTIPGCEQELQPVPCSPSRQRIKDAIVTSWLQTSGSESYTRFLHKQCY